MVSQQILLISNIACRNIASLFAIKQLSVVINEKNICSLWSVVKLGSITLISLTNFQIFQKKFKKFQGEVPGSSKNICILQFLKLGLKLTKNLGWLCIFHVHCNAKSQENFKRFKILNSQVSCQKQNVYVDTDVPIKMVQVCGGITQPNEKVSQCVL